MNITFFVVIFVAEFDIQNDINVVFHFVRLKCMMYYCRCALQIHWRLTSGLDRW